MKSLVVAPSWIGDTIMMQPLLSRLKGQQPASRIEVLAPDWSAPLLRRMPEVDAVLSNPFAHGQLRLGARRALGRRLASADFRRAYILPNSWKSALIPWFARIPERVGYRGEMRYGLLNRMHRLDAAAHPRLVDRYALLAGPLEGELQAPHLTSTTEQRQATCLALGVSAARSPVVCCPGAEYGPAKRWPVEHFATLARRVGAGGTPVWLVGSEKDRGLGDAIVALARGAATNLCGRTTLEQAVDLVAGARAVVANDSGLMHVAAALGRPLVALYGSSSPGYTPPLSPHAKILSRQLACSPCFRRECPLGHLDCLAGLDPDTVFASLSASL